MTNEDKLLICYYIGLVFNPARLSLYEYTNGREFYFNLNDASFVKDEMVKLDGQWDEFCDFVYGFYHIHKRHQFTAWLMSMEEGQAKNFFKAIAEWRRSNKQN